MRRCSRSRAGAVDLERDRPAAEAIAADAVDLAAIAVTNDEAYTQAGFGAGVAGVGKGTLVLDVAGEGPFAGMGW